MEGPEGNLYEFLYPDLRDVIALYHEPPWYYLGGVSFREFLVGVERPFHLLTLSPADQGYEWDEEHSRLSFVADDDLSSLAREDIDGFGDFWWIDFAAPERLAHLHGQELLELLYLKHFGRPLSSPHFPTLRNHFLYLGHDDGWHLRLWVDAPERLGRILATALSLKYLVLSGRWHLPRPDEAIGNQLVARAGEGLLLDLSGLATGPAQVPLYVIGAATDLDMAHRSRAERWGDRPAVERLVVEADGWHYERDG